MAVSKVVLNGRTLIDVTQDTVASANLLTGNTATKNDGTKVNGAYTATTIEPLSVTVNGTYTASSGSAYNPVTVNVEGGGGSSAEEKQVNFIDYDGTILYSYTAAEANALTELPANPAHNGLTAQGWNWTLAQIKSQLTAIPDGAVWIGQMYITDDGKTRIHLTVDDITKSFWLGLAVNGTVSIDWGDNSELSALTGTSLLTVKTVQHTYGVAGDYVIQIVTQNGGFSFYTNVSGYSRLIGKYETSSNYYNQAYSSCVTAVEIGNGITTIGSYGFNQLFNLKSVTIPHGVTSIGNYAFQSCYVLKSLTIPEGVTSISNNVFNLCNALESLTIPDGVTTIGSSAFNACYALKSLTIPNSVTSIGNTAFNACHALKSLNIPDSVTSIGTSVFQNCYALKSLTIPNGVTSIGNNVFSSCFGLKSLTIPDGVTSIGNSAIQNCRILESLTIPDGVRTIGSSAFNACNTLKSLTIPNGVTTISSSTFGSCYSLRSMTIPAGVTSIGNSAFGGCYNMEEYHFLRTTPPTLGTTVFSNIQSGTKIYVPVGSLEAYQTATNWSVYASYMEEEPT